MGYLKIGIIKLYYEEFGIENSQVAILLHGWNENRNIFKFQIEDLSQNYHVITLDMRGHGKSSKPRIGYSYSRMAKDLYYFNKYLEIDNPILIGHSMGGQIALTYYLKYNNCKKLVLISSPCSMPIQLLGIIRMGQEYLTKKLRAGLKYSYNVMIKNLKLISDPDNKNEIGGKYTLNLKEFQVPLYVTLGLTFNALSFNVENRLKDIEIPVLILAGEKDDLIPIPIFEFMQKEIPNSKLIKFENCSHFCFIEDPKKTNQFILDFLKD
ncbi:MAG: alpha/beta fold hydrolase [Candidatus Helarchaeota archaeon]